MANVDDGIQFEIQSGGSDTNNGGGFSPAATFATDLAATSATGSSPVVTSASYNFISRDVGHWLFVKSGTNWSPGFYQIASVAANAATLTASIGSAVLFGTTTTPPATPLNIVTGCATTASPTGGTWGIDYSRKTTPGISYTDAVIDATTNTKFTSVGNPVGPHIVGNVLAVTAGTGWTVQLVQVASVSGTTATCNAALGATSSIAGVAGLGGSLATPGKAMSFSSTVNKVHTFVLGPATYTLSSSNNVAGGRLTLNNGGTVCGYVTNRYPWNTDTTNRPIFQSNSNTYSLITAGGGNMGLWSVDFENGNSNTAIVGYDDGSNATQDIVWNCKFNALSVAVKMGSTSILDHCWINACTSATTCITAQTTTMIRNCVFTSNTLVQIGAQYAYGCIFYNNGWNASGMMQGMLLVERCLLHSNNGSGGFGVFQIVGPMANCILWNNTGTSSQAYKAGNTFYDYMNNNAFGSNTSDYDVTVMAAGNRVTNKIVLTADPCTAASSGDFSINNVAGGGALLRGLGFPVTFANGLTTNSLDVGPAQHVATAGGLLVNSQQTGGQQ